MAMVECRLSSFPGRAPWQSQFRMSSSSISRTFIPHCSSDISGWRICSSHIDGFDGRPRRIGCFLENGAEYSEEKDSGRPASLSLSPRQSAQARIPNCWQGFPISMDAKHTGKMMSWTALALILGLQACYSAGAMPEVDNSSFVGDVSDIQSGVASAFLLIFFSEIGDKTFFIAALLATRKSSAAVFSGTFGALVVMTLISVSLGRLFHYIDGIIPYSFGDTKVPLDDLAAVVLLVYFGVTTLLEASSLEESKTADEQQEAELAIAGVGPGGSGLQAVAGTVAATFVLVFVAEWGDKSFFSTVALAAASSPLGVVIGAVAGHGAATLLAVLGGSFLGTYISEKIIAYVGGVLFLVFAAVTLLETLP